MVIFDDSNTMRETIRGAFFYSVGTTRLREVLPKCAFLFLQCLNLRLDHFQTSAKILSLLNARYEHHLRKRFTTKKEHRGGGGGGGGGGLIFCLP